MKEMCLINCRRSRSVHLWRHSSSSPTSAMSAAQTGSRCQPEPLCLLGIRHLCLTCMFMDDMFWPASASFEDDRRTALPCAPRTRHGLTVFTLVMMQHNFLVPTECCISLTAHAWCSLAFVSASLCSPCKSFSRAFSSLLQVCRHVEASGPCNGST